MTRASRVSTPPDAERSRRLFGYNVECCYILGFLDQPVSLLFETLLTFGSDKEKGSCACVRPASVYDIIQNNIIVSFGRGEDNKAVEYASLAQQKGYLPTQKVDVHNRVLVAALRERLEKGLEMPSELFNMFVGNQTKIKRSK